MRKPAKRREPVSFAFRIVLYVVYGLPLLWIVLTSLKSEGDVISSQATIFFTPTIASYRSALADPQFLDSMRQSGIISLGTTFVCVAFAIPMAYALARIRSRVPVIVLAVLVVLQMVPQTANLIPLYSLMSQWGLLNTNQGLILADSALLLPWAVLLLRPFFASIPEPIEEAALIDGARSWRQFFSIALPLARNGILTVTAIIFLVSWGEFLYAVTFMVDPGNYPMSALIAQQAGAFGIDWPKMMALAVASAVPVFLVYVASYRLLRTGLTLGAVK